MNAPFSESLDQAVQRRRAARMQRVDMLDDEWRAFVHDYGFALMDALTFAGITKAKQGRHVVETVLNELSPIRNSNSCQGIKVFDQRFALIPRYPSDAMIEASMATVCNFDLDITKRQKHELRLVAAINAGMMRRK